MGAGLRAPTSSQYGFVLNGAEMVGVLRILLAGFWLVRADAITIGTATAAALYFIRLVHPIMTLLYLLDEAQSAGAALARLVGVTDLPAPPVPDGAATAGGRVGGARGSGSPTRAAPRCCTASI